MVNDLIKFFEVSRSKNNQQESTLNTTKIAGISMCAGITIGAVLGAVLGNVGVGISFGVVVGSVAAGVFMVLKNGE